MNDVQMIREKIRLCNDQIAETRRLILEAEDHIEQMGAALGDLSDKRAAFDDLSAARRSAVADIANTPQAPTLTLRMAAGFDRLLGGQELARANEGWDQTISAVEVARRRAEDELAGLNDQLHALYDELAELEQQLALAEIENAGMV